MRIQVEEISYPQLQPVAWVARFSSDAASAKCNTIIFKLQLLLEITTCSTSVNVTLTSLGPVRSCILGQQSPGRGSRMACIWRDNFVLEQRSSAEEKVQNEFKITLSIAVLYCNCYEICITINLIICIPHDAQYCRRSCEVLAPAASQIDGESKSWCCRLRVRRRCGGSALLQIRKKWRCLLQRLLIFSPICLHVIVNVSTTLKVLTMAGTAVPVFQVQLIAFRVRPQYLADEGFET